MVRVALLISLEISRGVMTLDSLHVCDRSFFYAPSLPTLPNLTQHHQVLFSDACARTVTSAATAKQTFAVLHSDAPALVDRCYP